MLHRTPEQERDIFDVCTGTMLTIPQIPQPVIASVHGVATATSCHLVATCDLVAASESAKVAAPGVKIGWLCSTPMVALSRNIGRKRALRMLLTGEAIDAHAGANWGPVNRVVAPIKFDQEVMALALQIASSSSLMLNVGNQAFYRQIAVDQQGAYERKSRPLPRTP